jgi:hypothetical protein
VDFAETKDMVPDQEWMEHGFFPISIHMCLGMSSSRFGYHRLIDCYKGEFFLIRQEN